MERLFRSLGRSIIAGPEEQKALEREVAEAAAAAGAFPSAA
jgi:hypothetical protein